MCEGDTRVYEKNEHAASQREKYPARRGSKTRSWACALEKRAYMNYEKKACTIEKRDYQNCANEACTIENRDYQNKEKKARAIEKRAY